jgi:hypothetical protein
VLLLVHMLGGREPVLLPVAPGDELRVWGTVSLKGAMHEDGRTLGQVVVQSGGVEILANTPDCF